MKKPTEPRFENEEWAGEDISFHHQDRRSFREPGKKKRRWWIPLTLILIVIVALGTLWFVGNRSEFWLFRELRGIIFPEEEEIQIIIPAALFAGEDIEEIAAHALEEKGVDEITHIEGDKLLFTMSPEVKNKLLEEAQNDLEEILSALKDGRQYSFIVEISYDSSFENFSLVIEDDHTDQALVAASELFVAAVYYQHLNAAGEEIQEVAIVLENNEIGDQERLAYPEDLNRVASLLESPEMVDEELAGPAAGDEVIVDTGPDNLNLRDGPAITYLIIDVLNSGTVLEVIDEEGDWLNVITPDQQEGWVHGDYVKIADEED
ncbi:MAG: SH3 domain-containing protein [Bacillota bacterium]